MEFVRSISRTFGTGARAVLHVEQHAGAVLVEGYEGETVELEATLHVWGEDASDADEDASRVERGFEQDGNRVIVRAPALSQNGGGFLRFGHSNSRVDYRLRVPRETAARVLSRSGRVTISRLKGRVHTEVLSGRCSVEAIEGDVTALSRSGSLSIEDVGGDVTAEARSGRVSVRKVRGSVTVEARSGALDVEDVGGDVRATARTGSLTIGGAQAKVQARSRCGGVRYRGAVQDDVDIEVHTGSITFAVETEKPFFIDAESRVGSVRSELPPRRVGASGPPADGGPKVRLRTNTGSIRLVRAD